MLVDNVTLLVKAGDGGDGAATFIRNSQTAKGGPDGGNGGNGGNIYFQGSMNIRDLSEFRFKKEIMAENGIPGKKKNLYGKNAPDTTIFVPIGTLIKDLNSNSVYDIKDTTTLVLIAKAGKGGRGNNEFKTATDQTPFYAEKGTKGQQRELLLTLRLIADIGLIGLPNAGKSSLLKVLTNATPKIGDYPFTTLEPNIGVLMDSEDESKPLAIADIPGLIEGASKGKGLGVSFLKHIEKTKILVHCIEATVVDAKKTYETVRNEFEKYDIKLLEKPEIILLTKVDLADAKAIEKNIKIFQKMGKKVYTCSIYQPQTLEELKEILIKLL